MNAQLTEGQEVHFIGIGGIGVSGLAQLALKYGYKVSGSDVRRSAVTDKLSGLGARIHIGHQAEYVQGCALVVYSSAIRPDNPERREALRRGIPVIRRAEFLSDLMQDKTVITVTGAHGKTTTSSMAAKLLLTAGLNPTVAVGGILREDGDNMKFGDSPYFVAEADESDGTFLCYEPTYSLITNIDQEHLDHYGTYENLLKAFETFAGQTKPQGCVIYCSEDRVLSDIVLKSGARSVSYGQGGEVCARNISFAACRLSFDCVFGDDVVGPVSMSLIGRHNVSNALAIAALGRELGLDFGVIQRALREFKGVERRFQIKYETKDICVVDDYAHHPTEIEATISSAKLCGRGRVVVVFQPHRFSRTRLLLERFSKSFLHCDELFITDIYGAGEDPLEGVTAGALTQKVRQELSVPVTYSPRDGLVEEVLSRVRTNDLVLFLGAGDITKVSDEFAKRLQR
ncbi:MAG: UDP-N-acetylmuramate--L-alanine ligase [Candidatus Omnitrophota bacterium]